jgi:hypothetical protein
MRAQEGLSAKHYEQTAARGLPEQGRAYCAHCAAWPVDWAGLLLALPRSKTYRLPVKKKLSSIIKRKGLCKTTSLFFRD